MLLKRPVVMSYRIGPLGYLIVSSLVKVRWFALPNILADRMLVPELIQKDATPERVAKALDQLLACSDKEELLQAFDEIHRQLIKPESTAADEIIRLCSFNVRV